jgi:hypothetical protein
MHMLGARFDPNVSLNYTRLNIYGQPPFLLGNYDQVVSNPSLKTAIFNFYTIFQKRTDYIEQLKEVMNQIFTKKEFFIYYNSLYWYMPLNEPFVSFTYTHIPLPGTF